MLGIHDLRGTFYPSVTLQVWALSRFQDSRLKIQGPRSKTQDFKTIQLRPQGRCTPLLPTDKYFLR